MTRNKNVLLVTTRDGRHARSTYHTTLRAARSAFRRQVRQGVADAGTASSMFGGLPVEWHA